MYKDIVIIGGGPGGYTAAIRAAQLGASVCLIERDSFGGTCLNRGCIPTKALYRNAEILNNIGNADEFGIKIDGYSFDVAKIQERKRGIVKQLTGGIEQLLKANGVEVLKGNAAIKDKNIVQVSTEDGNTSDIVAKNIIIATGSKPLRPGIPGIESKGVYTSEEMLEFDKVPKKLAVIGGGVIGMEFACIFNSMGAKVTVIEFLPGILAQIDTDLTKRLAVQLKKKGIEIHTGTKVTGISEADGLLTVSAEGKKGEVKIEADAVLVSTGRLPVTQGLNLDALGVEYDRKGIKVDDNFETSIKGIYAIGDVNGKVMLAHAAAHQGILAAETIMGISNEGFHADLVPGCIFIFPEIASVGITEDEAKAKVIEYKTSKFMFGANGKALTIGEPEGLVKVIASKEDVILGVHIMGPHASDLIHEGALAVSRGIKTFEISDTIHAHPTLAETFVEAVMGLNGEAIHMVPARK